MFSNLNADVNAVITQYESLHEALSEETEPYPLLVHMLRTRDDAISYFCASIIECCRRDQATLTLATQFLRLHIKTIDQVKRAYELIRLISLRMDMSDVKDKLIAILDDANIMGIEDPGFENLTLNGQTNTAILLKNRVWSQHNEPVKVTPYGKMRSCNPPPNRVTDDLDRRYLTLTQTNWDNLYSFFQDQLLIFALVWRQGLRNWGEITPFLQSTANTLPEEIIFKHCFDLLLNDDALDFYVSLFDKEKARVLFHSDDPARWIFLNVHPEFFAELSLINQENYISNLQVSATNIRALVELTDTILKTYRANIYQKILSYFLSAPISLFQAGDLDTGIESLNRRVLIDGLCIIYEASMLKSLITIIRQQPFPISKKSQSAIKAEHDKARNNLEKITELRERSHFNFDFFVPMAARFSYPYTDDSLKILITQIKKSPNELVYTSSSPVIWKPMDKKVVVLDLDPERDKIYQALVERVVPMGAGVKDTSIPTAQPNLGAALQEESDLSISQEDYEILIQQLQNFEQRHAISLDMLDEKLEICKRQQRVQLDFSTEDAAILQKHFDKHRNEEVLLLERRLILLNPKWEIYYQAIQLHFSGLIVSAIGIGSGYTQVARSKETMAFKYVVSAIAFAFPTHHGLSLASAVTDAVRYLDAKSKKTFLKKIKVFGPVTESEVLGERVARLLLRARVHAGDEISQKQANRDAEALINAIVTADKPLEHNENTAETLLKAILGHSSYRIDPLCSQSEVCLSSDTSQGANSSGVVTSKLSKIASIQNPTESITTNESDAQPELVEKKHFKNLEKQVNELGGMVSKMTLMSSSFHESTVGARQVYVTNEVTTNSKNGTTGEEKITSIERHMYTVVQNHAEVLTEKFLAIEEEHMVLQEDHITLSKKVEMFEKTLQREDKKYDYLKLLLASVLREGVEKYQQHFKSQSFSTHGSKEAQKKCLELKEKIATKQNLIEMLNELIIHFSVIGSSRVMRAYSLDTCIIRALENKLTQNESPMLKQKIDSIVLTNDEKKALTSGINFFDDLSEYKIKRESLMRALTLIRDEILQNQPKMKF